MFKQYGNIVSCKLETYTDGKSKGYAYVQFLEEADAERARNEMNDKEVRGKKLEINIHEKKDLRKPLQIKFNNLFVKNLPKGTDDNALKALFAEFGEIESAQVQKDEQGQLKDYGYVCFKDCEHAETAMNQMNKKKLGDIFLIVSRHVSKKDNEPSHGSKITPISQNLTQTFNSNVFVKFIPNEIDEEALRKAFAIKDAQIISVKLTPAKSRYEEGSSPYQIAYVLYNTVQAAQRAIQQFDQSTMFGPKPLKVELWISKEEQEQERKKRESQQVNQFISSIFQLSRVNSYPNQFPQQPGYGNAPQGYG